MCNIGGDKRVHKNIFFLIRGRFYLVSHASDLEDGLLRGEESDVLKVCDGASLSLWVVRYCARESLAPVSANGESVRGKVCACPLRGPDEWKMRGRHAGGASITLEDRNLVMSASFPCNRQPRPVEVIRTWMAA